MLIFLSVVPCLIFAQSEGDVRLADGPRKNIGRLEIFWQGKWSTFCGLSIGGAEAACRQLGFYSFIIYKPLYKVNPNANITQASAGTPIAIDHTLCSGGENLHVLRCGYSTNIASFCNHTTDIVLQCQTISLWQRPYQTQVRLNHTLYPSSGVLEIYIDSDWGNVCGNKFNMVAANSACRQMGYTSASLFDTSSPPSTTVTWLDDVSCNKKQSCNCLNGCFSGVPSQPTSCSSDHFVHVTCTYDIGIAQDTPPGSQDVCLNEATCDGPGSGTSFPASYIVAIVVGIGLLLVIVFIIVPLVVCDIVLKSKRRHQYVGVAVN